MTDSTDDVDWYDGPDDDDDDLTDLERAVVDAAVKWQFTHDHAKLARTITALLTARAKEEAS